MEFEQIMQRQINFSGKVFGPGARTKGICQHIRKELAEIENKPFDLYEWIDIIILGMDGAWRAGFTAREVAIALLNKQDINVERSWPPPVSEDLPIEHIKE